MRRLIFRLIALLTMVAPAICFGANHIGKYVNINNDAEYIQLNPDNTFELKEIGSSFKGTYVFNGNYLSITFLGSYLNGMSSYATLKGTILSDADNKQWKLQVSETASSNGKQLCANCYWGTSCGAITTDDVVAQGLVNENPGYKGTQDGGPFKKFACDNGRQKLGVLWSAKPCGETGGLSGVPQQYAVGDIFSRAECRFGN